MNLTKADYKDLKKVTAKIVCNNESEGTGTIVSIGDLLYVLTAAHVLENDTKNGHLDIGQIKISMMRNSQLYNFSVIEVVMYDRTIDVAVLCVSNNGNMTISGLDKVRILKESVNGPGELCGFHKNGKEPKHYTLQNRGKSVWAVNFELKLQSREPVNNFEGISGGGVFYADSDKNLYLTAFMSELGRLDGNNNEFICPPSSNFCKCIALNTLIDSRNYDYISDTGVANSIDSGLLLNTLDHSGYDKNQTGIFIENEKTASVINALRNDDEPTILLTALSGMGKSKLIYEAFKDTERMPNRYYAKYDGDRVQLVGEMTKILTQNYDSDGIIIIDDCPMELIPEVISTRNNYNKQFRIIMCNHDFFNDELNYTRGYNIVKLIPNEMKKRVDQYIGTELEENERNQSDVNEIKKLAGGYPQMAIELVKAYKEDKGTGPEAVTHLMPKLLNLTKNNEKEEKIVWQTLSLCMPFPYKNATHEGFKYLINENHFTPLEEKNFESRRSLTAYLIDKFSPTLIDVIGDWLYVRPFPLAVWLTSEWFKHVCNTSAHFKELVEDIKQQPDWVQNSISEGFCKHIQQMHGNKEAFRMVEQLVNSDVNDPFFNEENLCSGLGSKLFLAMSSVNPAAMASALRRAIGHKNIAWLKTAFDGSARRNVVWALEKLCFAAESYNDAVFVMAKLAFAENENIGNNATAQFVQLFHIYLAGTEVNLKQRLQTLELLVDTANDDGTSVIVHCFDAAFCNGGFSKMGGAEKFGFENKKDYSPKSWKEIFDYWDSCKDLLLKWIDKKPEIVTMVGKIVEDNVYAWARDQQQNILVPLMERIAEIKDYHWNSGYEALAKSVYSFGVNAKLLGIDSLMEKLRNGSYMNKLNDARFKLQGKYHLNFKEQQELTEKLFAPLAEEFLLQKVYANPAVVNTILEDKNYIPIEYVKHVVSSASNNDLKVFFDTVLQLIKVKNEDFYSSFLDNFCSSARSREPLNDFLKQLKTSGRETLYVSLLAVTEDEKLSNFQQLYSEQKNGKLKIDSLPVYLRFSRSHDNDHYLLMLKAIRDCYPHRPNDLISYVKTERFMMRKNENPEVVSIVKEALIKYGIDENNDRMLSDYSSILIETLQQWHDAEFAKAINKKMILVYNHQMVHLNTEGIFTELLKDYFDDVWPDFIKAFLGPDTFLFYYQVKDELGSGFGFGQGPFFNIGEELIKKLCKDNPDTAPSKIASMVPCFELEENGNKTGSFNKWFIWLLDNFGEQKEVRSSLSANLGSFSWTGDISPYYEHNIKCFKSLLDHKKPEVREWAEKCMANEKEMLEREKSNEDFIKIRYDM